ncbi:MAG: hypothetical protein PF637_03930 [Spirochaetes bacterium]|jgi:hypothetical protein|nr:hypothetical protein [Spirochaetota bacterium]
MIDTTVNIRFDLFEKLCELAEKNGVKPGEYAIDLLHKLVSSKIYQDFSDKKTVAYQKTVKNMKWKKLHIYPEQFLYETLLDSRKMFKCSVSYLLAFAIENNYVLQENNNLIETYNMAKIIICNKPVLVITWGQIPKTEEVNEYFQNSIQFDGG